MNREIISYGQHFMKNELLLDELVSLSDLSKEDLVLEVGAGDGRLTKKLAKNCAGVLSFEIDDAVLNDIVISAQNTLAQNSWDFLMDCPSRERACWTNDLYYSMQSAEMFFGNDDVIKSSVINIFTSSIKTKCLSSNLLVWLMIFMDFLS